MAAQEAITAMETKMAQVAKEAAQKVLSESDQKIIVKYSMAPFLAPSHTAANQIQKRN